MVERMNVPNARKVNENRQKRIRKGVGERDRAREGSSCHKSGGGGVTELEHINEN